jgi:cytochrome c5
MNCRASTRTLALFIVAFVGCKGGSVGHEPVSRCVPEGACNEAMFERGMGSGKAEPKTGETIFGQYCVTCHGIEGRGGQLTSRIDFSKPSWQVRFDDREIIEIVSKGRPPQMPPTTLSATQLRDLVSYMRLLRQEPPSDATTY